MASINDHISQSIIFYKSLSNSWFSYHFIFFLVIKNKIRKELNNNQLSNYKNKYN